MLYGPIQLVVITFENPNLPMDVRKHLVNVREAGIVRVVDILCILKDEHSELSMLQGADLDAEDADFMGMMAGALFGNGAAGEQRFGTGVEAGLAASGAGAFGMTENDLFEVADRIPAGSAALFLLLEHVWAHGLRDAVTNSEGTVIAHGWITPETLITIGAADAGAAY